MGGGQAAVPPNAPLLSQDAPYLDLAPYMPDYYKPQFLLDFEDRLPGSVHGSDSFSLNSFNSVTSTNLEWDDSAIAPSSEGKGRGRAAAPGWAGNVLAPRSACLGLRAAATPVQARLKERRVRTGLGAVLWPDDRQVKLQTPSLASPKTLGHLGGGQAWGC